MILPHVTVDPHAAARPGNVYTVRSLYLDSDSLDLYYEKLSGLKDRVKLRIRGYNNLSEDSPVYLEIKRKTGPAVVKRRSALLLKDAKLFLERNEVGDCVLPNGRPEESMENARQFLFHVHSRALRPVICIEYEREAYFSKLNAGVRFTLDTNLRADPAAGVESLARTDGVIRAMNGSFILEVKTDSGVPLWLQLILSRLDVRREAISKYAICISSLGADGGFPHTLDSLPAGSGGISLERHRLRSHGHRV